jgi:hypothetical protein
MSETKTYSGGCHCGNVRYDVSVDLAHVNACNCSICSKMGWLLTFVPSDQFTMRSGEGALTNYQFAKKHINHLFCPTCGIHSFSRGKMPDGREIVSINVRCLEGVDASAFPVKHHDGKSL